MKPQLKRYIKLSAAIHVGLIVAAVLYSFVSQVRKKNKPHEIMTYIDIQASIPEMPTIAPVQEVAPPEPEPPKVEPIPEPVKKKPIKKSTKKIRKEPKKAPPKRITKTDLKKTLSQNLPTTSSLKAGEFPYSWYLALVRQKMYDAWNQPSELTAADGFTALVTIRIQRDGSVSKREVVRDSGNPVMDESVRRAIQAVSFIKPLPPDYREPYRDVSIEFALTTGI